MAVIAIDLGGTKLAAAIFSRSGNILHRSAVRLEGRAGGAVGKLTCGQIAALLELAGAKEIRVGAIGVSVPGISYSKTGRVWAPNIAGWERYPLRKEIEAELRRLGVAVPVVIDSDRACYILGEVWRGAARGCRNVIFLAVGTGIGAGILVEGKILRGAHDIAGAIGWLALDRPFRREYSGCGCFEYHASGEGLAKVAKEMLASRSGDGLRGRKNLSARDIFAAAKRGDRMAKEVLAQGVEFWGMAVANLVSLFNPEKIIFGGGVFGPAVRLLPRIYAEARRWAQPIAIKQVKLQSSGLGDAAGLYGGGYLALQAESQRG